MGYFGVTPLEIILNILVHIVGIVIFVVLTQLIIKVHDRSMRSWKLLYYAAIVFVIKKIVVGLKDTGIIFIPSTLFNVIIVAIFIYALLTEMEVVKGNVSKGDISRVNRAIKRINEKL